MSNRAIYRISAFLVFLVSMVVYYLTMAATVSFWDAGEFIATSYILGIPHSPGTPLYVLVGRVFSMLPLVLSTAQKVNLLSVTFAALGVLMAYLIMVQVCQFMFGKPRSALDRFIQYLGPAVGAFFLTFSDTYWFDATESEVYSLSAFVMGLCTLLAVQWLKNPAGELSRDSREKIISAAGREEGKQLITRREKESRGHSRNLIYLIIYLLSLGIGFHLGTILVYGGVLVMLLMIKNKSFSNFELLVFTFGLAVFVADMTLHKQSSLTLVGLVVFAALVIWSTLSEGKFALTATTLLILGISVHLFLYIRSGLNPAIDEVDPENWRSLYAHLRREQYPPLQIFSRKASFAFQFQHFMDYYREQYRMLGDRMLGPFNLGKASVAIPTALGLYGIVSNFFRERKTWVLNFTSLFLNSLGLIVFLNFSDHEVRERDYFYGGAFYFFSIFIGIGASAFMILLFDYLKKRRESLVRWVVPVGLVLLLCSLLPSGYHWFSHDRSHNFIPRDYAYNMLAGLEPDAILFTNGDNDTFPLWYIQYVENFRSDVRVANLSLLNTDWYIKQCRDEPPRVPISMTDLEIERLRPVPLKDGGVAWKCDLAVQHIINQTNWSRPIYFAVTTPREKWAPYAQYLEMQGMVRKLTPLPGEFLINEFMMKRNFEDIFEFRGFLTAEGKRDNSMYKSYDTNVMFTNFSVASMELASLNSRRKDYSEAVRWAELALELNPGFDFAKKYLGIYYLRNGQADKAMGHYMKMIGENPNRGEFWIGLASVQEETRQLELALQTLHKGTEMAPEYRDIFGHG
ncbi:MAG: DUF2723 domain-containing protein, partial [Candidatus Krumholzibacteriota bacterium]|nr:DUF2723 domain-containing protein [Candidatus Krumholzibacteriota bacterium]